MPLFNTSINTLLSGLILCSVFSCRAKEEIKESTPNQPERLEILWKSRIMEPNSNKASLSMNPILHDRYVICNSEYSFVGKTAPVLFHDTASGMVLRSWSDYIKGHAPYLHESSAQVGEYLILCQSGSINCINLNTGQTAWQSVLNGNRNLIYTNKSHVYVGVTFNGDRGAAILRSPVDQEKWDTVYSFNRTDRFIPFFDSMGFGELSNGDEVVVWKNRSYHSASKRTDIFAYNLTADTLMWRNKDLSYASGILPLQIDGNKIFGAVFGEIFSIDINTGSIVWSRSFDELAAQPKLSNFDLGAMAILGSKLILKGDGPELVYLNKNTGVTDKIINTAEGIRDQFSFYKHYLVFTSGISIEFVDRLSGETVFSTMGDSRFSIINSKILFDPSREVLYFHDGNYLYCARIPKNL